MTTAYLFGFGLIAVGAALALYVAVGDRRAAAAAPEWVWIVPRGTPSADAPTVPFTAVGGNS